MNMEDIAAFADRVAVLRKGRIALLGTPREVFSQESQLQEMHLAVPAITRLIRSGAVRHRLAMPTVLTVEEAIHALQHLPGKEAVV